MRHWQKAIDIISVDRNAVYTQIRRRGIHSPNNNLNNSRLAIHELCKLASCPTSVRFSQDEFSEDEEDDDEHHDGNDTNWSDETAELDKIFDACELEEGSKIHEVTQFMIDASHSLGPTEVAIPRDHNDENENDNNLAPGEDQQGNNEDIRDHHEREQEGEAENQGNNVQNRHTSSSSSSHTTAIHQSILTVADSMGKTPLHILCENSCDSNMLRVILESTREATGNPRAPSALSLILAQDARGSTPLHYLAYSRECPFSSLKLMMDYCKPRSTHFPSDASSSDGSCSDDASQQTSGWIDPSLCQDEDGETPLHWALHGYMSPRRIGELTRHSLDAIMVRNQKGKRPFDQFVSNFVDADWTEHDVCGREAWQNVEDYLRVVHHNQSRKRNKCSNTSAIDIDQTGTTKYSNCTNNAQQQGSQEGESDETNNPEWSPLHFIAEAPYEFPPIFTDLGVKYLKDDLRKVDAYGRLPLHVACGRRIRRYHVHTNETETSPSTKNDNTFDDTVAMKLLKAFPRASLTGVTTTKQLALHIAVQTQQPMSLIAALIRTYPRSLNIQDPVTKLLPYALAGVDNGNNDSSDSNDKKTLSVSFALLRADPSVIQIVQNNHFGSNATSRGERLSLTAGASHLANGKAMAVDESYMEQSSRRIRRLTIR